MLEYRLLYSYCEWQFSQHCTSLIYNSTLKCGDIFACYFFLQKKNHSYKKNTHLILIIHLSSVQAKCFWKKKTQFISKICLFPMSVCVWKRSNVWGKNTLVGNCVCSFTSTGVDPMAGSFRSTTRSPLELTSSWQACEWHQWEWNTMLRAKLSHNEWQGAGGRISCLWTWKESFSSFFTALFSLFLSSRCTFPQPVTAPFHSV